ncbi:lipoprotein [Spiroplasma endosymbiont of Poecilobothrus nobilitatus]|uniref:lipoprotein n=1 Tax=Spiroplasma endosymbiont of Poecilobothrus nobilitatus TaxID=1209220 RepID=UPI00313C17D0
MKKILSLLGTFTLIGTSTISLVACDNIEEYTTEKLTKLKEENKINTSDSILEWIASQEKPFNQVDNKYYFVVWHGYENNDWRIIKFQNTTATMKIDNDDNRQLEKTDLGVSMGKSLYITNQSGIIKYVTTWPKDNGAYFKAVYRWNDNSEPNIDIENKLKSYLDL